MVQRMAADVLPGLEDAKSVDLGATRSAALGCTPSVVPLHYNETRSVKAGIVTIGTFIVHHGSVSRVTGAMQSKTGKHGHAKVHFTFVDVQSGQKMEAIMPAAHDVEVPIASSATTAGCEKVDNHSMCVACSVAPKSHAFIPWVHLCVCESCGRALGLCPSCHAVATDVVQIHCEAGNQCS